MKMKIKFFLIIAFSFFIFQNNLYSLELNELKVIDLASESLIVKQAEMQANATSAQSITVRSIYDTNLGFSGSHLIDKSKSPSAISPDRTDITHGEVSIKQNLPTGTDLSVGYSVDRTRMNSNIVIQGRPIFPTDAFYEPILELQIKQPIFKNTFGYADRKQVQATDEISAAALLEAYRIKQEVIYQALASYWTAVMMQRYIEAVNYEIDSAEKFIKITTDKKELGTADEPDLLAAKSNLMSSLSDKETAQIIFSNSIYGLKKVLNISPDEEIKIANDNVYKTEYELKSDLIKTALEKRPDFMASKNVLTARSLKLSLEKNKRWPSLDLVGSLELNNINNNFSKAVSGTDNPSYVIGLQFSFPLQNRQARGNIKSAESEKARALYALKQLENDISNEVARSYDEYERRKVQVKTLTDLARTQRAKLAEELKKYTEQGRSSASTVSRYEQDLSTAQILLANAHIQMQQARLDLLLAIAAWENNK